jgi:hypothetical protein
MAYKATDQQMLKAWSETQSPTQIAARFGMTVRATQARLRSLGVPPLPTGGQNVPQPTTPFLRHANGRLDIQIDNGVVVVFSDAHYWPGTITTAHRALVKMLRELRPRAVVANGDVFDGAGISRHPRIGWDKKPSVIQELDAVTQRLNEIEAASPGARWVWPLGNHDARFETTLAAQAPQYEGVTGFSLKDHFPLWQPCWALWINDNVVVKHRYKGGIHATHNNAVTSGKTIVTGHLHSLKVTPYTDYNGTRFGVDTGTLAEPYGEPFADYTELNPVNWRSGFAVLTFHNGRLLWPELVHVMEEGRVEFRGQVIEV